MKPAAFGLFLIAALLTGCDSSESATAKRGAHEATATVQIFPSLAYPAFENFLANQAVILKTGTIIKATAEASNLDPGTISSALEIRIIEGTDLLAVTAHHDDKDLPKVIVQSVLDTYRAHRQQFESLSFAGYQLAVREQKARYEEDRNALVKIVKAYGITDFDHPDQLPLSEPEMFRYARQRLSNFETVRDQLEVEIKKLGIDLENGALLSSGGLDLPTGVPGLHAAKYREALEHKHHLLARGLGPNHPEVLATETLAKEAEEAAKQEMRTKKAEAETRLKFATSMIELIRALIVERLSDRHGVVKRMKENNYQSALKRYSKAHSTLLSLKSSEPTYSPSSQSPRIMLAIHKWSHQ